MRLVSRSVVTLAVAALPAAAAASPVNARLSTSGLQFVQDRVAELVPSHLELDPISVDMWDCDGGPATFTLLQPKVDITLNRFDLSLPGGGVIRARVGVTVSATGQAQFDKLYACYGHETCDANVSARNATATIDIQPAIDGAGKPKVVFKRIDVQLAPSDVDLTLSNCPEDAIVNLIVGFVKDYGLQLGIVIGERLARDQLGPVVEGMLANYMSYSSEALLPAPLDVALGFKASLVGIDVTTTGLQIRGDVDLTSKFPLASCLTSDPGEPGVVAGAAPDLGSGTQTDVGVAVNFGLVQDAVYHLWHEGLLCVRPDSLPEDVQADLKKSLGEIGHMLPGFPEGTTFTFEGQVEEPPLVEGTVASDAKLTLHVNQLNAQIIATFPDKSTHRLGLGLDASVTASVVMDPRINALALQIDGVKLDRMDVTDHLGLTETLGIDFGRLRQLIEEQVLPDVLGELGQIPITGPVFGGLQGLPVYVILKELKTSPAYLTAKADLFMAPANDNDAPTTSIDQKPSKIVRPAEAKLVFGGMDKQDPVELLRYRVLVDGKEVYSEPSFVRELKVGEAGKSGLVHVEVHAVDLAGNEDRAGQQADVDVDGVVPELSLRSQLRGEVGTLNPTLDWTMSDDRTSPDRMVASVKVTQIPIHEGDGTGEIEVWSTQLAPGTTSTQLEGLEAGKQYRVELTVQDEAGNEVSSTQIFAVSADAGTGGCSIGGRGHGGIAALLMLAGLVALGRRRRRD